MDKKKDPRGRKPVNDPKIGVRAYIYKSAISKLGGIPAVQEIFHEAVEKKLKVKK